MALERTALMLLVSEKVLSLFFFLFLFWAYLCFSFEALSDWADAFVSCAFVETLRMPAIDTDQYFCAGSFASETQPMKLSVDFEPCFWFLSREAFSPRYPRLLTRGLPTMWKPQRVGSLVAKTGAPERVDFFWCP